MKDGIRPVRLPIQKVVVRRKYFPRARIRKERVRQFRQAMQDGEHIPPIIVADEGETGAKHVVIEGAHRFVAARLERKAHIYAYFWSEKEKELWLADAARMNDKTRAPLTTRELEEVVRRLWRAGITDSDRIAARLNRNVRFVQRVLKPLKDEERNRRDAAIVELAKQGLSQREIARKVGLTHRAVRKVLDNRWIPNDTVSFSTHPERCNDPRRLDPPQALNICPEMLNSDSSEQAAGRGGQQRPDSAVPSPSTPAESHQQTDDSLSDKDRPQEPEPGPFDNLLTLVGHTSRWDDEDGAPLQEPRSMIPELSRVMSLNDAEKLWLRTLELVQARWSAERIAKRLGQTEVAIRNIVIAYIALWQQYSPNHPRGGRSAEEIADALGMRDYTGIRFMEELVFRMPGILPPREEAFWWFHDDGNLPPYRTTNIEEGSLYDIYRWESIYRKHCKEGTPPPWERIDETPCYEDLPQEIDDRFLEIKGFYDELIKLARKGMFRVPKARDGLLEWNNIITIAGNLLRNAVEDGERLAKKRTNQQRKQADETTRRKAEVCQ